MAVMKSDDAIRYEPDEMSPWLVSAVVGFQGVMLILPQSVLYMSIVALSAGQDDTYLTWAVFAALALNGVGTALQATRLGRLGTGHVLITGTATPLIAISIMALSVGGPAMLASLVLVSSLLQFMLAAWMPLLRRVITPLVSGTVLMLVAVTIIPIAIQRLTDVSEGTPLAAGPIAAAATLIVTIALGLRAAGAMRLWTPLAGIVAGCAVAGLFGLYDPQPFFDAPWVGIPAFTLPDFNLPPSMEFWSLLPAFLVMTLVIGIMAMGGGIAIQQASWRTPRVPDFRLVQGAVRANGVASLMAGLAGIMPTMVHSANSVSLTSFTGVASRRVGFAFGIILIGLALLPKLTALLLTVPAAVAGAFVLIIMGHLMVEGIRMVARDGLDYRKALVVGVSFSLGSGLQSQDIFGELFGNAWGLMLNNGVLTGGLAAILITSFMELIQPRRRRLKANLDVSALTRIDGFLRSLAADWGWNDTSTNRLCLVAEEVLLSLLGKDKTDGTGSGRSLTIYARRHGTTVDLEFLATPQNENIEDRIAYLSEQVESPEEHEMSFRLLKQLASTVRHQKYHGIDIVSVQVNRSK